MKRLLLPLCFLLVLFCDAQQYDLKWPLDTPCTITGNYGELRPNHFHAGIDLSTGGRVNRPVFAAEGGYVSRIRVSSAGYGHALYITHPGGFVTVYAHLNSFSLKIARLVREEQETKKSFEVELLPAPNLIQIKKGEVVGLSGNTGGSSGPHLHFEIRDEISETPLNPLFRYMITDKTRPVLEAIGFYDLSDSLNPALFRTSRVLGTGQSQSFVLSHNPVGFAFSAYDQVKNDGNKNNVYNARLFFDGKLIYAHSLNKIDFADNRYVNEFSEKSGKYKLQKCFVPTLFPPRLYDSYVNKGVITFGDTLQHTLKLVLEDEKGNTSAHEFKVRSTARPSVKSPHTGDPLFVNCTKDFVHKEGTLNVYIPASTFYRSMQLKIVNRLSETSQFVVGPEANLRSAYVVSFPVPQSFSGQGHKLVLRSSAGVSPGVVKNDSVYFYLKSTGVFSVITDNEPPVINTSLSAKRIQKTRKFSAFSFRISDRLSGVAKYSLYLNNIWVLAAYDAKSSLLTYTFDEKTPHGNLHFAVEAEDRCGNKKRFEYTLRRH